MGKGKGGGGGAENLGSKKAQGQARKADAANAKKSAAQQKEEAAEAAEWSKGAKSNSKAYVYLPLPLNKLCSNFHQRGRRRKGRRSRAQEARKSAPPRARRSLSALQAQGCRRKESREEALGARRRHRLCPGRLRQQALRAQRHGHRERARRAGHCGGQQGQARPPPGAPLQGCVRRVRGAQAGRDEG